MTNGTGTPTRSGDAADTDTPPTTSTTNTNMSRADTLRSPSTRRDDGSGCTGSPYSSAEHGPLYAVGRCLCDVSAPS
jgi:hypothetical protein